MHLPRAPYNYGFGLHVYLVCQDTYLKQKRYIWINRRDIVKGIVKGTVDCSGRWDNERSGPVRFADFRGIKTIVNWRRQSVRSHWFRASESRQRPAEKNNYTLRSFFHFSSPLPSLFLSLPFALFLRYARNIRYRRWIVCVFVYPATQPTRDIGEPLRRNYFSSGGRRWTINVAVAGTTSEFASRRGELIIILFISPASLFPRE